MTLTSHDQIKGAIIYYRPVQHEVSPHKHRHSYTRCTTLNKTTHVFTWSGFWVCVTHLNMSKICMGTYPSSQSHGFLLKSMKVDQNVMHLYLNLEETSKHRYWTTELFHCILDFLVLKCRHIYRSSANCTIRDLVWGFTTEIGFHFSWKFSMVTNRNFALKISSVLSVSHTSLHYCEWTFFPHSVLLTWVHL